MPKYKDIDLEYELDSYSDSESTSEDSSKSIGYPVHVYFIELAKEYMKHIQWHWHMDIEIIIVNHGEIVFQTNDQKVTLSAGQGVIINSNVMHCIEAVDDKANCSMYSTVFHPTFLFGYGDIAISEKYMSPIVNSSVFQFMTLDEEDPVQNKFLELTNEIIAANLIKNFGYELITKAKLCEFWISLLHAKAPESTLVKKKYVASLDEARAKELILYVEDHYADKITLDELAEAIHVSKSECCRCFKRAVNLSPIEYLMRYRIFVAASLIKKKDPRALSFSELAFSVGFNNASYFNKIFRQYLGCTPSEYKRKLSSDPDFELFGSMTL